MLRRARSGNKGSTSFVLRFLQSITFAHVCVCQSITFAHVCVCHLDHFRFPVSTFDGTAIASATVKYLVESCQCLTLFATHYHSLLDEWAHAPNVRLGHMGCMVEQNKSDAGNGNITFLYTLGSGACPKVCFNCWSDVTSNNFLAGIAETNCRSVFNLCSHLASMLLHWLDYQIKC
jgi:MutS domain V